MELNQITRIIFQDKQNYKHIDDTEKGKLFFMFNKLIARKLPSSSDTLNRKGIDTSLGMDIWFEYAKPIKVKPSWFSPNWAKLKSVKKEGMLKKYDEIDKLILSYYPEALKEEQKRIDSEKDKSIEIIKKKIKNKK